ncbi:MAG: magnesium/cobalt efflux protein [Coxiella sp. RIFCSPHIGHO2_12_FULL_42_15]|nr:MAG: magnesium/cobalt efflux protein [Coxiella sp. RIFCSPHIGHO2_12_FULL_42_15]
MAQINTSTLLIVLVVLILVSGFFSASETGMMALNRYRLRHLARKGHVTAQRVMQLLRRPDRILGVILIGNTFANILASSVATLLAAHYFGDLGILLSTIVLTFIVLIFAEITPKTFAALHPQGVAFLCALPLKGLLFLLYPLVWVSNGIANAFLRVFGVKVNEHKLEHLSIDELRTVVREASGKISSTHQHMLLRILELEQATVDDVMVPRNEILGIDITEEWDKIFHELMHTNYEFLPVYREDIDQVIGMLNLRSIVPLLRTNELTKEKLLSLLEEIYYIPEMTFLNRQLLNFQRENKSIGLVIDEYGDIQGLVKMQDILEEIVGQFAVDLAGTESLVRKQKDGSYLVDGAINIRDLNRIAKWNLPTEGPRTLSGLIIETLELIPSNNVALRLSGYPMEVLKVSGNKIKLVQVWPGIPAGNQRESLSGGVASD